MAAASSGMPVPSVATVFTMGGVQLSPRTAKDGAASVRTGWVNGDDADAQAIFAIVPGQLIYQSALPRPWRPRQAENPRSAAVWKGGLQQLRPAPAVVLHNADSTGQGTRITSTQLLNPRLDFWIQTAQCKAAAGQDGTSKVIRLPRAQRGSRTSHSDSDREHLREASSREDL